LPENHAQHFAKQQQFQFWNEGNRAQALRNQSRSLGRSVPTLTLRWKESEKGRAG
jgi:hypothetical protein